MFSLFNETAYYWYYLRRSFIWRGGGGSDCVIELYRWSSTSSTSSKMQKVGWLGQPIRQADSHFWATCTKYMYMNLCALWWNLIFLFNVYISPLLGNQNIQRKRNLDIRWQRYKPLNNKALVRNLVYSLKMATKGTKLM